MNEATQEKKKKRKFWGLRRAGRGRGVIGVKMINSTTYVYGNVTVKPLACIINIC